MAVIIGMRNDLLPVGFAIRQGGLIWDCGAGPQNLEEALSTSKVLKTLLTYAINEV